MIDHVLINKRFAKMIKNYMYRGTDINFDHIVMKTDIIIKSTAVGATTILKINGQR